MTTADWALGVSLGSAAVSLAGFVWNVWSKFIYPKPRVRMNFNLSSIIGDGKVECEILSLGATNMGPAELTLHSALLKGSRRFWVLRPKVPYAILLPLHNFPVQKNQTLGPFSGGLPKKLAVGEQFSVYFPANHESFRDQDYWAI